MSRIFTITNFNVFIGRYSRSRRKGSTEKKTGWNVYDGLHERFPVLALRNREAEDKWPLSWTGGRNTKIAVDVALQLLKAWQAFRPSDSGKIIDGLSKAVPKVVVSFQKRLAGSQIRCLREVLKHDAPMYNEVMLSAAKAVGYLSSFKNIHLPMLGSKVLHFMLPEFFPIWDTLWVKKALINEDMSPEGLEGWLPEQVHAAIKKFEYRQAALLYVSYLALMLRDLNETPAAEYSKIENAYITHSEIEKTVIKWHFYDIAPILFELCLLGKHDA
jgi:hypothetical protein